MIYNVLDICVMQLENLNGEPLDDYVNESQMKLDKEIQTSMQHFLDCYHCQDC